MLNSEIKQINKKKKKKKKTRTDSFLGKGPTFLSLIGCLSQMFLPCKCFIFNSYI